MRRLFVNKKTGFRILDPYKPVIIRDKYGKLFYSNEAQIPRVREFNIPPNLELFVESGRFRSMEKPVKYQLSRLPDPERSLPKPFDFQILFAPNPNKCTIDWRAKTITFDPKMKELGYPALHFILFHEIGHSRYETEKFADLYAANEMKKYGYNPNQIGMAPITSLSDRNYGRKKYIVKQMIKTEKR